MELDDDPDVAAAKAALDAARERKAQREKEAREKVAREAEEARKVEEARREAELTQRLSALKTSAKRPSRDPEEGSSTKKAKVDEGDVEWVRPVGGPCMGCVQSKVECLAPQPVPGVSVF